MNMDLTSMNELLEKADFMHYAIKGCTEYSTFIKYAKIKLGKGIEIKNDFVLLVYINSNFFEFAFDDFKQDDEFIKFYNDNVILTLHIN